MLILDSSVNVVIVELGNVLCCPSVFITISVCATIVILASMFKHFFEQKDMREKEMEKSLLDGVENTISDKIVSE